MNVSRKESPLVQHRGAANIHFPELPWSLPLWAGRPWARVTASAHIWFWKQMKTRAGRGACPACSSLTFETGQECGPDREEPERPAGLCRGGRLGPCRPLESLRRGLRAGLAWRGSRCPCSQLGPLRRRAPLLRILSPSPSLHFNLHELNSFLGEGDAPSGVQGSPHGLGG